MAVITAAGTYGPFSLAAKAGSSAFQKLDQSRQTLSDTTGQMDRAEISREAAKLLADSRPSQLVQVLSSTTGRTEARVSTMRDLVPPADTGASSAKFKGTASLVDSRAAATARVRSIDMTVGGPNSAGALKGAQVFKLPEPKSEDTQLGRAKITQVQAEERAKAIAEAKIAARDAVNRLQNSGALGIREEQNPKPAFSGIGGAEKSSGALDLSPKFQAPKAEAKPVEKPERAEPEREDRRNDRAEAEAQRRPATVPGAFNAQPGATLNFLA